MSRSVAPKTFINFAVVVRSFDLNRAYHGTQGTLVSLYQPEQRVPNLRIMTSDECLFEIEATVEQGLICLASSHSMSASCKSTIRFEALLGSSG